LKTSATTVNPGRSFQLPHTLYLGFDGAGIHLWPEELRPGPHGSARQDNASTCDMSSHCDNLFWKSTVRRNSPPNSFNPPLKVGAHPCLAAGNRRSVSA
jgi:hypothetical protein